MLVPHPFFLQYLPSYLPSSKSVIRALLTTRLHLYKGAKVRLLREGNCNRQEGRLAGKKRESEEKVGGGGESGRARKAQHLSPSILFWCNVVYSAETPPASAPEGGCSRVYNSANLAKGKKNDAQSTCKSDPTHQARFLFK